MRYFSKYFVTFSDHSDRYKFCVAGYANHQNDSVVKQIDLFDQKHSITDYESFLNCVFMSLNILLKYTLPIILLITCPIFLSFTHENLFLCHRKKKTKRILLCQCTEKVLH